MKSSPSTITVQPSTDLVLERLPNGELAWLRPEPLAADGDPRYVVTDLGRRALAMDACFGPWPSVAEIWC